MNRESCLLHKGRLIWFGPVPLFARRALATAVQTEKDILMPRFRSIVLLLAALLGPAGCAGASPPSAAAAYDLVVLHTNDMHSNYSGFDAENRICRRPLCQGGSGGLLRAKQAVDAIRRKRPNVILLDAGDQFQGTLFFSLYKETCPPLP